MELLKLLKSPNIFETRTHRLGSFVRWEFPNNGRYMAPRHIQASNIGKNLKEPEKANTWIAVKHSHM